MSKYFGYKHHHCGGKTLLRPKLHRRAAYFGFTLRTINYVGNTPPSYVMETQGSDDKVLTGDAKAINEQLASWESNEVDRLRDELTMSSHLYEHVDELGARIGFSIGSRDNDVMTGIEMLHHLITRTAQ